MPRSNQSIGRSVGTSSAAIGVRTDNTSPEARHGTADLTLVAFIDYRCPACRKGDPAMRKAVARDGNIRLVYKDRPIFGAQSERTAEVALAADRQGIYPSVDHALMRMPVDAQSMRRAVEQTCG